MQNGQTVRLLNVFIEYGGNVYSILGLSTAEGFGTYQNTFMQTMRGFSRLTDQSILNIEPTRLRVVTANRVAPFRTFVPNTLPGDMTPQDLAILNQVELDEQIQQGQRLKLPGS